MAEPEAKSASRCLGTFLFASDLHGSEERYRKLFSLVRNERPAAVFLGGDLLPSGALAFAKNRMGQADFLEGFLLAQLETLRREAGAGYPRWFVILGNDDARSQEAAFAGGAGAGLWEYVHGRRAECGPYFVYGCSFVPPTPFALKDWERYDVSRFVDPGCVAPEDGRFTTAAAAAGMGLPTLAEELEAIAGADDLERAIFLFHSPPYRTALDRAALDGRRVEGVPLDVHVGSIAVRRFIEARQPWITLHGHVHESARLSGSWRDAIGRCHCFSAAHDGPELAVVSFDPQRPQEARRRLL